MPSNGSSYADRLATEIWHNCWTYCGSLELRRLCLVCKYFRTICQPLLFREQTIIAPRDITRFNWIEMTEDMHNKAVAFHELAASPLAAFVRQWRFTGDHTLGDIHQRLPLIANIHMLQDTWRRLFTVFTTTLGAYQRLAILRLSGLHIDFTVRATLESLKFLEELEFSECDIVARTGSLLPLKSFGLLHGRRLNSEPHVDALSFIAPDNLHRLMFGDHVDAEPVLKALSSGPLPRLSRITVLITACAFECFSTFLACCPELEFIHIRPYSVINEIKPIPLPDPLPATTLPILKSFKDPLVLAGRFIRNRPVELVELVGSAMEIAAETVLSTLSAVSEGSVSLRMLSIWQAFPVQNSPEIFGAVGSYFPDLCTLKLEFIDQERDVSSFADSEEDPEEGYEASGAEDTIDTRIVVLPEGGPVPRMTDEESAPVFSDKKREQPQVSPPENLLPGYMYNRGRVYPPKPGRFESDADSSPIVAAMEFFREGRLVLPPQLEVLTFMQQPSWAGTSEFDTDEQHRAVLLLESVASTLREIGFCHSQDCWLRDRHLWIRDRTVPGKTNWGRPGAQIVSQIWNEDGSKRKDCAEDD
ncbi:hypothetical protein C8R45DRAFT_1224128 [Mycena sanguinolenta]|nr:hypothetical protein C8R45DRAFT_1224128 [Mycena sanguinolenta]